MVSNRGPSAYQPKALPLGQTGALKPINILILDMQTRILPSAIPPQHTCCALFTTCSHAACRCMGTINYSHYVWLWLTEINGVTPNCRFTLFRSTIFFPFGYISHKTRRLLQPIVEGINSLLVSWVRKFVNRPVASHSSRGLTPSPVDALPFLWMHRKATGLLSLSCGCTAKTTELFSLSCGCTGKRRDCVQHACVRHWP